MFCIGITNNSDLSDRGDKAFEISINSSALDPDVIPMNPSKAKVTIIDDECKLLHYKGNTVVWEKLVVGNIHEKKLRGKKFLS